LQYIPPPAVTLISKAVIVIITGYRRLNACLRMQTAVRLIGLATRALDTEAASLERRIVIHRRTIQPEQIGG
jgi:hypothetical protein